VAQGFRFARWRKSALRSARSRPLPLALSSHRTQKFAFSFEKPNEETKIFVESAFWGPKMSHNIRNKVFQGKIFDLIHARSFQIL
jgi:hypothetical protein